MVSMAKFDTLAKNLEKNECDNHNDDNANDCDGGGNGHDDVYGYGFIEAEPKLHLYL